MANTPSSVSPSVLGTAASRVLTCDRCGKEFRSRSLPEGVRHVTQKGEPCGGYLWLSPTTDPTQGPDHAE